MLTLDITGYTPQEALALILFGLESREAVLKTKITAIKAELAKSHAAKTTPGPIAAKPQPKLAKPAPKAAKSAPKPTGKRTLSPEARERIIAAQKKRWAGVKRAKKAAAKASAAPHKTTPHAKLNLAPTEPVEAVDIAPVEELVGAATE